MNGKRFSIFSRQGKLSPTEQLRAEAESEAAELERSILERDLSAIDAQFEAQKMRAKRQHLLDWLSRELPGPMVV